MDMIELNVLVDQLPLDSRLKILKGFQDKENNIFDLQKYQKKFEELEEKHKQIKEEYNNLLLTSNLNTKEDFDENITFDSILGR